MMESSWKHGEAGVCMLTVCVLVHQSEANRHWQTYVQNVEENHVILMDKDAAFIGV